MTRPGFCKGCGAPKGVGDLCQSCCPHDSVSLEKDYHRGIEITCDGCWYTFDIDEFERKYKIIKKA